jgi:outer membrane lipoprotein-sorting protein
MKKILFLALVISSLSAGIFAQTADEIVNKYFETVGGMEKWKNLKSMKMTGNLVMQMGQFPFTIYRKAPNKFKVVVDIQGQQIIPQAFDGDTAWMLNPFAGGTGPEKVPDDQVRAVKEESDFEDPFIDYKSKGIELTYDSTTEINGVKCYVVKMTKHKGEEGLEMSSSYFFDMGTGLVYMIRQKSSQSNDQEIDIYLSDYREVKDGILMPYVMDTQAQGQSLQKLDYSAIDLDMEMPDDLFKMPQETPAATTN